MSSVSFRKDGIHGFDDVNKKSLDFGNIGMERKLVFFFSCPIQELQSECASWWPHLTGTVQSEPKEISLLSLFSTTTLWVC